MSEHSPDQIIQDALREFSPRKVFCLFSGGHDSVCATHLSYSQLNDSRVVHIDTGTGIAENRKHVEDTKERFGWNFSAYGRPSTRFPFPWQGGHWVYPIIAIKFLPTDSIHIVNTKSSELK